MNTKENVPASHNLDYYLALSKQVRWPTFLFILITPMISVYGLMTTAFVFKTWLVAFTCFLFGVSAIGTCYHRLYSHRTFSVHRAVEVYWLYWATSCFSMSAIEWVRDHRTHHKYTETDLDPYNIKKGFWWAHMGWLFFVRKPTSADVSDVEKDPLLRWQKKRFYPLALLSGWVIPALVCGLGWGDWRGGIFIAALFKSVFLHHSIFCINSWAHTFGEAEFNDSVTPRDSIICALLTAGEGYHNFHHEFPNDYRNGVHWSALDLNKWIIYTLECVGLAKSLKRTSSDQVKISRLQMIQRKVERESLGIFTGLPLESLPQYTEEQIWELNNKKDQMLLTKDDLVYDVKDFVEIHPGGKQFVAGYIGKDISRAFGGGVYNHSNSAHNILQTLRCGRLLCKKSHDA